MVRLITRDPIGISGDEYLCAAIRSLMSAQREVCDQRKLRLCFVRDFFWLFDSFIISFATVLALRAEIIGGVSTSTSVPGTLVAPLNVKTTLNVKTAKCEKSNNR